MNSLFNTYKIVDFIKEADSGIDKNAITPVTFYNFLRFNKVVNNERNISNQVFEDSLDFTKNWEGDKHREVRELIRYAASKIFDTRRLNFLGSKIALFEVASNNVYHTDRKKCNILIPIQETFVFNNILYSVFVFNTSKDRLFHFDAIKMGVYEYPILLNKICESYKVSSITCNSKDKNDENVRIIDNVMPLIVFYNRDLKDISILNSNSLFSFNTYVNLLIEKFLANEEN